MRDRFVGPRLRFGMFPGLSQNQAMVAAVGGPVCFFALVLLNPAWYAAPITGALFVFFAVLTVKKVRGQPAADHTLKAIAHATDSSKRWHARPVGQRVEQVPREAGRVWLTERRDRDGFAGLVRDRQTLTAVARVELHSALTDPAEQDARLDVVESGLNTLAHLHDDPRHRIAWIYRHTPRRMNEELDYVHSFITPENVDSPQVKSCLEVLHDTRAASHEDEFYMAITQSVRDERQTAALLFDRLRAAVQRLIDADVAVAAGEPILTKPQLALMFKDAYDPFGKPLRDALARETGEPPDEADAWPDHLDRRRVDLYESDGAVHRTFWLRGLPKEPVQAGWQRPLLVRCDVPALTLVTVLCPDEPDQAASRIGRRATMTKGGLLFRQRHGQDEKPEYGIRADALARCGVEMSREDCAPYFWETHATVSAPSRQELEEATRRFEASCTEARLRPVVVAFSQAYAHTFTLPLGRGLEPRKAKL